MPWNFTRQQKNTGLVIAAIFFALIQLGKHHWGYSLGRTTQFWLVFFLLWSCASQLIAKRREWLVYRDMALFLLIGAAIGFTAADLIKSTTDLPKLDGFWLILGIIAAIIHYSPSDKDHYL